MEKSVNLEETKLLNALKNGSRKAFAQIYNNYFEELLRYVLKAIRHREDSEDIVQFVFTELWHNAQKRSIDELKPYLFSMAKYQIFGYWSKEKNIYELLEEYNEIDAEEHSEEHIDTERLKQLIDGAVDKLPKACRTVFELSKIEQKSHDQIAEELGLSKQTVKNQLSKALKILKQELSNEKNQGNAQIAFLVIAMMGLY